MFGILLKKKKIQKQKQKQKQKMFRIWKWPPHLWSFRGLESVGRKLDTLYVIYKKWRLPANTNSEKVALQWMKDTHQLRFGDWVGFVCLPYQVQSHYIFQDFLVMVRTLFTLLGTWESRTCGDWVAHVFLLFFLDEGTYVHLRCQV